MTVLDNLMQSLYKADVKLAETRLLVFEAGKEYDCLRVNNMTSAKLILDRLKYLRFRLKRMNPYSDEAYQYVHQLVQSAQRMIVDYVTSSAYN